MLVDGARDGIDDRPAIARPLNRQGRPRKWGDSCGDCGRDVQLQWMRHGLCGTCYQRHRRAGLFTTGYVDPAAAATHLAKLHATGVSYRWIAAKAGTSTVNLNNIVQGRRKRISGELAAKILAVPVPAVVDEDKLRHRALQTAGMKGLYVGVERRYRQDRARRGVPYYGRDRLSRSQRARYLAEREAFLAWLYEGMPAKPAVPKPAAPQRPIARTVDYSRIGCGDCDHMPCRCEHRADADIAWLRALADHDPIAAPAELQEAA